MIELLALFALSLQESDSSSSMRWVKQDAAGAAIDSCHAPEFCWLKQMLVETQQYVEH